MFIKELDLRFPRQYRSKIDRESAASQRNIQHVNPVLVLVFVAASVNGLIHFNSHCTMSEAFRCWFHGDDWKESKENQD